MPYWLADGLWLSTVGTVALAVIVGAGCGWAIGYTHRDVVELGRRNPLRQLARAYRELWADYARLVSTGRWT